MSKKLENYIAALKYGAILGKAFTIAKAAATALIVGPNGETNPTLQVDTSTASAATGIKVTGAAAGSGVTVASISSASNEDINVAPKGTGVFALSKGEVIDLATAGTFLTTKVAGTTELTMAVGGGTFTIQDLNSNVAIAAGAALRLGGATTLTLQNAVATPAGGSTAASVRLGTTATLGIYYGSGVPTVAAAQGSLYIRSEGSSSSTRLYVNSDGGTTWVSVTTAT